MLNGIFHGLFDSDTAAVIAPGSFLLCLFCSLIIGFLLAAMYQYKTRCTKSFLITLSLLPAVVCVVIMMVNGNIGAGVAVAGAFSLVRFRSAAGTAKEIGILFLAMGAGLIAGMGYLAYAFLYAAIVGAANLLYSQLDLGFRDRSVLCRSLSITIPEDLDYTEVFDPILRTFASEWELTRVKTSNMGSLFRLTYDLTLRDPAREKEMIDQLRCHNGNLEISLSRQATAGSEL